MKEEDASHVQQPDTRGSRRQHRRSRRRRRVLEALALFGLLQPHIALAIDPNMIALIAGIAQAIGT